MMLTWLPYPMLRVSLAFTMGIFIGLEYNIAFPELESLWPALVTAYWVLMETRRLTSHGWNHLMGGLALGLFVLAGTIRAQSNIYRADDNLGQADFYQAKVIEPGQIRGNFLRTSLSVNQVWREGSAHPADDRVLWYQDLKTAKPLSYGSLVVLKGKPQRIRPPQNPHEFHYANFMSRKNTFWQHWSDSTDILEWRPPAGETAMTWSFRLKETLKNLLAQHIPSGVSQEISMAMLLGERSTISDGLEDSFARSGTIHVLAVSGLHLGILYWVLQQVFGSWRNHRWLKWVFLMNSMLVLWCFTLLTGMAPSTQRAALMFSVLLLANTLSKQDNTVNTLAISALVILWIEPNQLYAVGFQLSFLALSGILYLQPWIKGWWKPSHTLIQYFWDISSVSLSAQLAVLPLSVYYFHQLPVYFILSNLFLIPLAFGILVMGILFFACSLIPALMIMVASPLIFLTKISGAVVETIADFPLSTVNNLYISPAEALMWYGILWSGLTFLKARHRWTWWIFFGLTTLMVTGKAHQLMVASKQKRIIIYQIPGHRAIDLIQGRHVYSLMDMELISDHNTKEFKVNSYRRFNKLHHPKLLCSTEVDRPVDVWMFNGKRLLLIKAPVDHQITEKIELKSDIVVVSHNSISNIRQIQPWLPCELLVIDGSNGRARAGRLEQQARNMGVNVHNSWNHGFKIINL